jgi:uncharacterized protein YeaO (DUF488 family)
MINLQRAYDKAGSSDGPRYLVERLWPRGVKKSSLKMTGWLKSVAPRIAAMVQPRTLQVERVPPTLFRRTHG